MPGGSAGLSGSMAQGIMKPFSFPSPTGEKPMLRLLYILIALVILLRLLGWTPPGRRAPRRDIAEAGPATSNDLVACARCGVHLPQQHALGRAGHWYCCVEHRDQS